MVEMPLIAALGRQRQMDLWVQDQLGLQSGIHNSQDCYMEKPCFKKPKKNINNKNK